MSSIKDESEEAQKVIKYTILENYRAGGSGWKKYTDEELEDLGLGYLIVRKAKP